VEGCLRFVSGIILDLGSRVAQQQLNALDRAAGLGNANGDVGGYVASAELRLLCQQVREGAAMSGEQFLLRDMVGVGHRISCTCAAGSSASCDSNCYAGGIRVRDR
jgi:hypothetical protein